MVAVIRDSLGIRSAEEKLESQPKPRRRSWPLVVSLAVITLGGLGTVVGWGLAREAQLASSRAASAPADSTSPNIRLVAVLPLRNATGDGQQDYIAEGLTTALATELALVRSLGVRSATSVQRYAHSDQTLPSIARELGVDALLEGTLSSRGKGLDVSVSLVDGRTDKRLWTRTYHRDATELPSLFSDVARGITGEIAGSSAGAYEHTHVARWERLQPAAYQLYLKGEFFRKRWMEGGCFQADKYFRESIRLDSTFAEAYANLASCYVHPDRLRRSATEVHREARRLLNRALVLDSTLAPAYYNLGLVEQRLEYDWPGAGRSFRHAVALDPADADAQRVLGEYIYLSGLPDEGLVMMRHSIELDPFQLDNRVALGFALRNLHRYDDAIRELRTVLQIEPAYSTARLWLAESFASNGKHDEAVHEYLRWLREVLQPDHATAIVNALEHSYAKGGWLAFWREELKLAQREVARPGMEWIPFFGQYCGPYYMARRYARLGMRQEALAALADAYSLRRHLMVFMKVEPLFSVLESDLRFSELSRKVGAP